MKLDKWYSIVSWNDEEWLVHKGGIILDPEDVTRAYFEALANDDCETASELVNPSRRIFNPFCMPKSTYKVHSVRIDRMSVHDDFVIKEPGPDCDKLVKITGELVYEKWPFNNDY
jgi:hypothetical protein